VSPAEVLDQARERAAEAGDRHVKAVAAVTEARAVLTIAAGALASEPSNAQAKKDLASARAALQDAETWEVGWQLIAGQAREAVAAAESALTAALSEDATAARARDVIEAGELLRAAIDLEASAASMRRQITTIASRHGGGAFDLDARRTFHEFSNAVRRHAGQQELDGNGLPIATEQRS
jgi:hypothetical protein